MAGGTISTGGSDKKPHLSFWEIWNMSFGFLGIQFGFALQNANVSRIFETLGADIEQIPILWIAAPLTGLIIQPIIGYFSDRTWTKLGRRRPYFLVGAILASLALFIMPNSPVLWIAAGMLWIMDASINISMEPFRAFVGDNLPAEQRTTGFAMQSFFIGIGAVIASLLPYIFTNWFGISNTAAEGIIPDSVKWSFYIGAVVFFFAVLWTVFRSKEYSPEELKAYEAAENKEEEYKRDLSNEEYKTLGQKQFRNGIIVIFLGVAAILGLIQADLAKELFVLAGMIVFVGILMTISGFIQRSGKSESGFITIMNDFQFMPTTMKQLAIVQFFSWFALFAMWIYTTNGVTSTVYDMTMSQEVISELQTKLSDANIADEEKAEKAEGITALLTKYSEKAEAATVELKVAKFFAEEDFQTTLGMSAAAKAEVEKVQKQYNKGADWVGVCFAVYNGFAAVFAFLLVWMAKQTSRKMTHFISLLVGGLSFVSIFFIKDPNLLIVSFVGVGLAWASILSMPYAILAGSIPSDKMGYYMGVFNFFIVIPQLVAATILGFLVSQFFGGQAIYALILGGISMVLGAISVLFVEDKDDVVAQV